MTAGRLTGFRRIRAFEIATLVVGLAFCAAGTSAKTHVTGGFPSSQQMQLCVQGNLDLCALGPGDYYVVPVGVPFGIIFSAGDVELSDSCVRPVDGGLCRGVNSDIRFSSLPEGMVASLPQPGDGCGEDPEFGLGCFRTVAWEPTLEQIGVHEITLDLQSRWILCSAGPNLCADASYDSWTGHRSFKIYIAVHDLSVHGIEFTQAIQVDQSPEELSTHLDMYDNQPPVPLAAGKATAVRVHLEQNLAPTKASVEIWAAEPGVPFPDAELIAAKKTLQLSRLCTAEDRRRQKSVTPATCNSFNFYVDDGPMEGLTTLWVFVRYVGPKHLRFPWVTDDQIGRRVVHHQILQDDPDDVTLRDASVVNFEFDHRFKLDTKRSDEMVLHAVSICLSADNSRCLARPVRTLRGLARLLEQTAPTHSVKVVSSGQRMRLLVTPIRDIDNDGDACDCFDAFGNKTLEGSGKDCENHEWKGMGSRLCEPDGWWDVATLRVHKLFELSGLPARSAGGVQNFYYGMVHEILNTATLGMVYRIGGHSGVSVAMGPNVSNQLARETVAHEVGHMLEQRHPLLHDKCGDDTNWLYSHDPVPPGGGLHLEVGFEVSRRRAVRPVDATYDIMSYCDGQWISPITSEAEYAILDPPPADPPRRQGAFWLVSGFIDDTNAEFEPIFRFTAAGYLDARSGSHRIELRDATGLTLFTRFFNPAEPQARAREGGSSVVGRPIFAELVPVTPGAARLIVLDPFGAELGALGLEGADPAVSILTPVAGATLDGLQPLSWSVSDADSTVHSFWVEYSADGGATWQSLEQGTSALQLEIDFDALPGATSSALLRVAASDGARSGAATTSAFSVTRKPPEVEIVAPGDGDVLFVSNPIVLEGFGFDLEDGVLSGTSLSWSSDVDGFLGSGERLVLGDMSPGPQTLTLTGVDQDANQSTNTIGFTLEAASEGEVVPEPSRGLMEAACLLTLLLLQQSHRRFRLFHGPGRARSVESSTDARTEP